MQLGPSPKMFEAKAEAKARGFCPAGVFDVEDNPRGHHPCLLETAVKSA